MADGWGEAWQAVTSVSDGLANQDADEPEHVEIREDVIAGRKEMTSRTFEHGSGPDLAIHQRLEYEMEEFSREGATVDTGFSFEGHMEAGVEERAGYVEVELDKVVEEGLR